MKPEPLKGKELTEMTPLDTRDYSVYDCFTKEDVKSAVEWLLGGVVEERNILRHDGADYEADILTNIINRIEKAFPDVLEEEKP